MVGRVKDGKVGANDNLNINEEGEGKKNKDVTKNAGVGEANLNKQKKGEAKLLAEAVEAVVGKGKDGKVGANDKLNINEEGEISISIDLDELKIYDTTHFPQPKVGEADVGEDGGDDVLSPTKEDEPKNNKDVDTVTMLGKICLRGQKCRSVISKFIRDRKVNERQSDLTENDSLWIESSFPFPTSASPTFGCGKCVVS